MGIRSFVYILGAVYSAALLILLPHAKAEEVTPGQVRNLCGELLTRPQLVKSVDVRDAVGLKILETELYGTNPDMQSLLRSEDTAFHNHELTSSAKYARLINGERGESLLLVPGIENKSVPGFDGVVLNARGEPIANYSLKTLVSSHSPTGVIKRAREGVRQARRFSFVERWFVLARLFVEDQSGHFHINPYKLTRDELRNTKHWLSKSLPIFGVNGSRGSHKRPTRVVVDIQSDAPMPNASDIDEMRHWVWKSRGLIESIIVLKGAQQLIIR